ncbi:MAG TPA: M24 family metallopeptidase [Tepidisphaeraceae bacterium]|nr:M24 family metallopeptidase [Tepidisphaeraceae bacterium]
MTERDFKLKKLATFLDRHQLDGVMLWHRPNFAWLTGGGDNHVSRSSAIGVAGLIATRDSITCICNNIESPRIAAEELAGLEIEIIDYEWHDDSSAKKAFEKAIGNKKFAADFNSSDLDLADLPKNFAELRWQLCPEEIERYRIGGRLTSEAIESACRMIEPGMTEKQIAGILDLEVHARGLHPVVTLIAADERLMKFRHPIPTEKSFENVVMLVTCADYKGLISNVTRIVHVGKLNEEGQSRVQAVADIDATINLVTKPRKSLSELFAELQNAYELAGHADQWNFHHQGGITGYMGREVFARPGENTIVQIDQAFAWNPSVAGCKSEDTVLISSDGIELLTAHSPNWPTVMGRSHAGELRRAGWLELE